MDGEQQAIIQQELSKALLSRQKLDSQLQETRAVISEINRATENHRIYKSFGSALLVQEKDEALSVLNKRQDFITNELKSVDAVVDSLNSKIKRPAATTTTAKDQ